MSTSVFMCHNSSDKNIVERIANKLREYGFSPWLDRTELRAGDFFADKIQQAIEGTDAAAVFFGKNGFGNWQNAEVRALLQKMIERSCPVIPVILPDCLETPKLPALLSGIHRVDFRDPCSFPMADLIRGLATSPQSENLATDESTEPGIAQQTNETAEDRQDTELIKQELAKLFETREDRAIDGQSTDEITRKIRQLERRLRDGFVFKRGDTLSDRFRLIEQLGEGGFGEVWKAWDRSGERLVAVKALHGKFSDDKSRREKFFQGAKKMARLGHPSIVQVVEKKGEHEGRHFFVLEYVEGKDLFHKVVNNEISPSECLNVILQVGEALIYAHEEGIIHRDVTPSNILVEDGGCRAKLTDFDLVLKTQEQQGASISRTGTFAGTLIYAAPEAIAAEEADRLADVYSLGMTAIFALYGKELPIETIRDTWEFARKLDADAKIRKTLARAVSWNRSERTKSVRSFCRELRLSLRSNGSPNEDLFRRIETPRDGLVDLWREIPAGEFLMGSSDGEGLADEHPRHLVRIERPFQISAVPITNAQYEEYDPLHRQCTWEGVSDAELAFHPVVNITLDQAIDFCRWLAENFEWARGARLATEEEWEYACRAGSTTGYWSGASRKDLQRVGWYAMNSDNRTHRVGEKPANPWGLYDVHGNVWEWTANPRTDYASRTDGLSVDPPQVVTADVATAEREGLVIRGGSYRSAAGHSRSAYRGWGRLGVVLGVQGFRVVLPSRVEPVTED